MVVVETERLYLRVCVPDDWVRLKPLWSDPRITQYLFQAEWTDEIIEKHVLQYILLSRTLGWTLWPVVYRANSQLIGICGFWEHATAGIEMGFRLLPEYWGQGLATEAAAATLQYGFGKWGFPRVVAFAQKPNSAAIRVMEKIGMTFGRALEFQGVEVVGYVADNPLTPANTSVQCRESETGEEPGRIKQVIVMRHGLNMRRGKQIAQGAHASMSFLCRRLQEQESVSLADFTETQRAWLTGAFAKVCCRVNSEEELMEIHDNAMDAGLEVHLITDSGKTEFRGEPTRTCIAIGPDDAEKIDAITGHLQLL